MLHSGEHQFKVTLQGCVREHSCVAYSVFNAEAGRSKHPMYCDETDKNVDLYMRRSGKDTERVGYQYLK